MPYIGNKYEIGDHNNSWKTLDDISSYVATFDGSATNAVSTTNNTIRVPEHRFIQGQRVTYSNGGGGNIGGLTSGTAYYIIHDTNNEFKLATSLANANASTAINLSAVGSGTSHTVTAAFDGVNKKFKITYSGGRSSRFTSATQLSIAINNILQRPNDTATFTDGFRISDNEKIEFNVAPVAADIFWGSILSASLPTFDISDNKLDNFTGDGSTTDFTLSHIPVNNEGIIVTINGVIQHPTDKNGTRAYSLDASVLVFTAAPANGDEIQVRHIGFAGATSGNVTGFYGRTGNVTLSSSADNAIVGVITATKFSGPFVGTITGGNDIVAGIITANAADIDDWIDVGNNIQLGNAGVITATTFRGDGDFVELDVDGHTNLDNVSIAGVTTGTIINATTFVGNGDFVELDVDGHTNLDNVSIAGVTTSTGNINVSDANFTLQDSTGSTDDQLQFGAGADLRIFHNASNSNNYIDVAGDGHLYIRPKTDFYLQNYTTGGVSIAAIANGKTTISYNGYEKLETTNTGVSITGNVSAATGTFTGNVSIGGVLTYEDVTNVDAVGLITARTGIKITGGGLDSVGIVTVRSGGYLDVRTGSSINTNATGASSSGTLHKNTTSGEFAVVSGGTGGNNYLTFYTSASGAPTEKLRIDSNGNLNINNNNPLSGASNYKHINVSNSLVLQAVSNGNAGFAGMSNNAYLNASNAWVRIHNDHATDIGTDDGNFYFRSAGAGTGTISWNTPLFISNTLRVGVNEASPDHMFHIKGTSSVNDPVLAVESSSWATGRSAALRLSYTDGNAREIRGHYDHGLQFFLNQGEAMRIDTNNNVSIGSGAPVPSATGYNRATLHLRQPNSGTSVGSQIKFTINALGHNAGDGGIISYWGNKHFYYNNFETGGEHKFFITNAGSNEEALKISTAGDLLINPGASGASADGGANEFSIEGGNLDIGMSFISPAANNRTQTIAFGDSSNTIAGRIQYAHADDSFRVDTAGSQRLLVNASGLTVTGEVAATQDYPMMRPRIDWNFAATKTLDPRIKFTRGGVASYVDDKGIIRYASKNTPRFDHHPTTGESLGILLEKARTNLQEYSVNMWQANHKNNVTVTNEDAISPDGTQNASKIVGGGSDSDTNLGWNSASVPSGQYANWSIFVKSDASSCILQFYTNTFVGGTARMNLELADGTTGGDANSSTWRWSVTPYPNGWYRVTWGGNGSGANGGMYVGVVSSKTAARATSPGSAVNKTFYAWGVQEEINSESKTASSYIPTYGAAADRGADGGVIDGEDFDAFFDRLQGTIVHEFANELQDGGTGGGSGWELNNSDYQKNVISQLSSGYAHGSYPGAYSVVYGESADSGDNTISSFGPSSAPDNGSGERHGNGDYSRFYKYYRDAMSWKVTPFFTTNILRVGSGGVAIETTNTSNISTRNISQFEFQPYGGNDMDGSYQRFSGRIRRWMYYDKVMTQSQLATMTDGCN